MDDVVAHAHDENGNTLGVTLGDVYTTAIEMMKIMYFDFMFRCVDATYDGFLESHKGFFERIFNAIHERFADHVEGLRAEKFKKMGVPPEAPNV